MNAHLGRQKHKNIYDRQINIFIYALQYYDIIINSCSLPVLARAPNTCVIVQVIQVLRASFVITFDLRPHLTQSSEIPWNFLGDSSTFCSNEATLGGSWILQHGNWSPESPSHDQKTETFSFIPQAQGKKWGWRLQLITNHAYVMKPSKNPGALGEAQTASTLVSTSMFWDGDPPHPHKCMGIEAPVLGTLTELTVCTSSSGYLLGFFKISFVINQP